MPSTQYVIETEPPATVFNGWTSSYQSSENYRIIYIQWSPVVSLAAPPLTSASSAAQCRFWLHVGCCVLLRGVSFWSLVPDWLLCSEGPFRFWVHQHGMIHPLSCVRADGPPFQILHLSQVLLFCPWLGWERL